VIVALVLVTIVLVVLIGLSTFVQTLYLESLRLRARDLPAIEFFRGSLEQRIGATSEVGVLTFSIIKHTSLLCLGIIFLAMASWYGRSFWAALAEAGLFAWVTMVVFSYVLPQALYRRTSARWLLPLTPLLKGLILILRPVTWSLAFLQSLADLGAPQDQRSENGTPAENIDALITAGAEEGLIEEEDRKLIQSVVAFGGKTLREVMTPRPGMVAVSVDQSLDDLRQLVINEQYSRIPVYEGTIDNIVGFVHVRDMFELDDEERERKTIRDLLRSVRSVPETKPVGDMLREMQEEGTHMAIVVDEYGNTAGLVTMEDMVEEIFGEIRDEHEPMSDVVREHDGSFIVSGSFDLDGLEELVRFRPVADTESTTIGGLVAEWMGRVPQPGESVERQGMRIEVLAGNELRVEKVRIARTAPVPKETANGTP
jgi:CBS domain containing-hemolysin-like protein